MEPAVPSTTLTLYPQLKALDIPTIEKDILAFWEREGIFQKSIDNRAGAPAFTFYEGPPSANGQPGIHHVMARAIKDLFCRYHTLKGKQVLRKAGWDTHGLPIELQVEKELGITKKDIGVKITVEEYNAACRSTVMRFKDQWDELTRKMGYWVDLEHPYITFTNEYIESVWARIKILHDKGLLYKGYTIQPYSPAAGTGLSSHELNMSGCYRAVKDTTCTAMFKVTTEGEFKDCYILAWTTTPWTLPANCALVVGENIDYVSIETLNPYTHAPVTIILAEARVSGYLDAEGENAAVSDYKAGDKHLPWRKVNSYKGKDLLTLSYESLFHDIPLLEEFKGNGKTFTVLAGDFVTTEDGTGVVHTAGTFGADDFRVLNKQRVRMIMGRDETGAPCPIVDKQGKYLETVENGVPLMGPWAGRYVKNYTDDPTYKDLDVDLAVDLKKRGLAFRVEKYEHNYPHCWRTDKPVLYYPLDSWFIHTSKPEVKQRMIALNNTINWKPKSTGEGRFGSWLENLEDWNLSRSRYWGIALPIWRLPSQLRSKEYEEAVEEICIKSISDIVSPNFSESGNWNVYEFHYYVNGERKTISETLSSEVLYRSLGKNYAPGMYDLTGIVKRLLRNGQNIDLQADSSQPKLVPLVKEKLTDIHRPFIDYVVFVHDYVPTIEKGKLSSLTLTIPDGKIVSEERNDEAHREFDIYFREPDLIDVWFDSGAMPYAQWHYPFENEEKFKENFPADFIAEGVDQTRGWFFTLHAIAAMTEDSVAFKNVVSNGLVLDKNGQKMSKRLGNAVNPFETIEKYGADVTRWYMVENAPPWENLKFNIENLQESQRKFFGTLYNTYSFFALYGNIDGYRIEQFDRIPREELDELDRWVLSCLNSLIKEVRAAYDDYDPTRAARAIEYFTLEQLSNWYVRLARRRFWKGEMAPNKRAAYQTLQHCLAVVAQLMSPIAPFFADWLYRSLTDHVREESIQRNTPFSHASIHLTDLVQAEENWIDPALEARMAAAQTISSLAHALRKKVKINVRRPLAKLLVPVQNAAERANLELVAELIKSEINVKEMEYITGGAGVIVKSAKANFKVLGTELGKEMPLAAKQIEQLTNAQIDALERGERLAVPTPIRPDFTVGLAEVEVRTQDIPGWSVATGEGRTVALDVRITPELAQEGLARELVSRIQNLRKETGLEVTDKIVVTYDGTAELNAAMERFAEYIRAEILANALIQQNGLQHGAEIEIDSMLIRVHVQRV